MSEVEELYRILKSHLRLEKECLPQINPVWSGEIMEGSTDSRRMARSLDRSFRSTDNKLMGR